VYLSNNLSQKMMMMMMICNMYIVASNNVILIRIGFCLSHDHQCTSPGH